MRRRFHTSEVDRDFGAHAAGQLASGAALELHATGLGNHIWNVLAQPWRWVLVFMREEPFGSRVAGPVAGAHDSRYGSTQVGPLSRGGFGGFPQRAREDVS
jgi:hypothetical protein